MLARWRWMGLTRLLLLAVSLGSQAGAAPVEGFLEPFRKIDLAIAEIGVVARLLVQEGDLVQAGQPLCELDTEALRATLDVARANYASIGRIDAARAERELRDVRLRRLEELRDAGHASQEEVDRARTDLAVSIANVLTAEEQRNVDGLECKKIEALLSRRVLTSPIEGAVVEIHKDVGELVATTSATLVTVVQLDPLRVVFSLSADQALRLKTEQHVPVVLVDAQEEFQGRIEFISPIIDADSGTVRVKVLLKNDQGKLRSGSRCVLKGHEASQQADPVFGP